jgi:uncharacterized damage-inducible protein DinB
MWAIPPGPGLVESAPIIATEYRLEETVMKMKSKTALAAAASALLCAALAAAQSPAVPAAPAKSATPMEKSSVQTGFRAEFLHQLDDVQKKITSLAEAVPADKYSWRPAPGVRSVGEVYMHIAAANLNLPRIWGVQPPAGIDSRGLEKQGDDKAKVAAALQQSFAHIRRAVETTPDADLDKAVKIFDHTGTVREAIFVAANHMHEHLGQSIAYARSNGVVPPWSQGQGPAGR